MHAEGDPNTRAANHPGEQLIGVMTDHPQG
jgi:hypothetical protein